MKRGWSVANAFNTTLAEGHDWYTTAKSLKSIGTATISEVAQGLAAEDPFKIAWKHLGVGISICETIVDLGLTVTELAQMKRLLDLARQVQAEYGPHMQFYEANRDDLRALVGLMSQLSLCSERVARAVADAEALLAGAGDDLFNPSY